VRFVLFRVIIEELESEGKEDEDREYLRAP
jgi:hypothetical protein